VITASATSKRLAFSVSAINTLNNIVPVDMQHRSYCVLFPKKIKVAFIPVFICNLVFWLENIINND
jgi:hypothetical protein